MSIETRFIEPLDVLFLRGNKLFGDPGSHGESLVPPWPSVAAGALRSRMLADERVDLGAFARGEVNHPTLGSPAKPGSFAVTAFHLARRFTDGRTELLIAPPADLVINEGEGQPRLRRLQPTALRSGLQASTNLPLLPVLAEEQRGKPAGGYWLTQAGWEKYLKGETPAVGDLVKTSQLWDIDHRVGVGLDVQTRRADDGKLFSAQAVSLVQPGHEIGQHKVEKKNGEQCRMPIRADYTVGFLASVVGASLPEAGSLRLGGDGRAAALHPCHAHLPTADQATIAAARRCRIVLSTPGIFADGWRLPGVDTEGRFALGGVRGKLVCATVPRFETISGWDLARHQPKPAQRVAPAGSVYWLDELDATPDSLGKLAASGLWDEACEDAARRAEGFNRFSLAYW